ncbi:acetate--CoA ligase family protein [Actinacidiphila sp. ITFR-21]|uniref:acetate--CoA ligase family protein n=1 Tax=Actinacidiphila sp. ITFR-21 TaxID=3075199 RepID=UPI00288A0A91|nr:acetate--CoA ligase family protein [Streptomyces sp. ITFR-21]WNI19007.1 acetate--CoA ligase family protein [Streptomyces sp. ITFR-21]
MKHGIAVVGASDHNFWSGHVRSNVGQSGYTGQVWPVNPNYETVGGVPAFASLSRIDGVIDAVVVAVAAHRCPDIVREAVGLGVADIVVVSDGFAERGPDGPGAALQRQLVDACQDGTRLYGPNCVGFADFRRDLRLIAEPIPAVTEPGAISIVSQSGALLSTLMAAVVEDGGSFDWCASLGNAARFDVARAIDYVCERGTTRSLIVYAETLGEDIPRLRAALTRARDENVAVVMLKAGRSAVATKIAYSHTASVAGDDAEIDAFLSSFGVLRVDSLEEMARVAVLAPLVRRDRGDGVAVIGSSGGQAAIAGDLAQRDRMKLARLTGDTMTLLRASAASGSFIENPFDLVGRPGARTTTDEIFEAVWSDPTVGFTLSPWSVIFPDDSPGRQVHRDSISLAVRTARRTGTPTVISALVNVPWTDWVLETRRANPGVAVVRGLENTIRALSRLFPDHRPAAGHAEPAAGPVAPAAAVTGEIEGRRVLAALGLPVVAGEVCGSAEEAGAATLRLTGPYVVKADVAGVAHKARLGLVVVGCEDRAAVEAAVKGFEETFKEHGIPASALAGYLVEEMATGTELLVGLTRSALGSFLTVALGGVAAGAGTAAGTVLLPAGEARIMELLGRHLPLPPQAPGFRAAAEAVARLCAAFDTAPLDAYRDIEVNPMMVAADRAAVVDALLVAREA